MIIPNNKSQYLTVGQSSKSIVGNMVCWHILAAFLFLSIEDFYQISANEFIDYIVAKLSKVDVGLHINHCENRKKKISFDKSLCWSLAIPRKTLLLFSFWPLIWLCSPVQKGQNQQAVDYVSLIISNMDTQNKSWKGLWYWIHFCLYPVKFDQTVVFFAFWCSYFHYHCYFYHFYHQISYLL